MSLPRLKDSALELRDRVAALTLKRDDVRNTLSGTELIPDLLTTLEWCNQTDDVAVLIIIGEGKAFSAGGNLKAMRERSGASVQEVDKYYRGGIQRIPKALQNAEIPVIAAVNGPAIGAGELKFYEHKINRRTHVHRFFG